MSRPPGTAGLPAPLGPLPNSPVEGGHSGAAAPLAEPERLVYERLASQDERGRRRLVKEVIRAAREREFTYRDGHHPVGLVPLVLPPRLMGRMQALTRAVHRFQMRAPELYRADYEGFAGLFLLERNTKAWLNTAPPRRPRPWELLTRPDFGLRPRAGRLEPALYELNSLMLGGLYIQSAARGILEERVFPRLGVDPRRDGLEPTADLLRLLERWLLECRRSAGKPGTLALVENWPPGGGFSELPRIAAALRRRGLDAEHGDPRRLELKDGEARLRGRPVGFAFRDFSFEDVGGPANRRMRAFRALWEQGRVAPGPPADFDQKGILECFTSERFSALFTRREARLFKEHVPWTRVLSARKTDGPSGRVDLPAHARRERERLVIKPSWSSGGDGILIGAKTAPARWDKAVDAALRSPGAFAVQEYIDAPRRPSAYLREGKVVLKDCRSTMGMFYDGREFGLHLRMSPKDIVNVAQGGALAPIYLAR